MSQVNRFGEPIHTSSFPTFAAARSFARMIGANVRRFSLLGMQAQGDFWVVSYRSRKVTPWLRDPRATVGVQS
jgi:hypothetical protein